MIRTFSVSTAATLCMTFMLLFTSCQQEEKYPTDLTVTTQSETTATNYSYWYKISGTITLTPRSNSTDTYDVSINDGNLYVSWKEAPNNISNYREYTLNLYIDFYDKGSTTKTTKNIFKTFKGIGNKYDLTDNSITYSIDGNVTENSFAYTIDYPNSFQLYKYDNNGSYMGYFYYDAKIKLTCTKV